ncbi:kinase-like domain-containing protein [Immersiella caudata]|uniref:Kinase-like domain-containing protein n=1 Tax=Immersiella caudata TaxID=314043 RepID=A0AA39XGX4_9PEZI|nr:kinase-like domain-containing protein [Immersiella caudata]
MPLMRPVHKFSEKRDRSEWERAQKLVGKAVELMKDSPTYSNLRFNRVLTWGGMGLVALFDVAIPNNPKQVVVKCELKDRGVPFETERACHEYLRRSKHIVQLVNLKLPAPKAASPAPSTPSSRKRRGSDASEPESNYNKRQRRQTVLQGKQVEAPAFGRPAPVPAPSPGKLPPLQRKDGRAEPTEPTAEESLLMIEFMRRGDLNQYLAKLSDKMYRTFRDLERRAQARGEPFPEEFISEQMNLTRFPDKVLWLIFQDLFKAVIGIVAPPRVRPGYEATGGDDGPIVDEAPPDPQYPLIREDTVHFDLDPKNVLIGDAETLYTPVHKISDLGLMKPTIHAKKNRLGYRRFWGTRIIGKPRGYWLQPEQFSQEWDTVSRLPLDAPPPRVRIAGNYSWKTNLYAIGTIMWCLVTRFEPPCPAYGADVMAYTGDVEDINPEKHSYAAFLNRGTFDHVDPDLRTLIIECMSDDPADRPRMADMYKRIEKKVEPMMTEIDEEVQMWCGHFYHGSLEAEPHSLEKLQAWLQHSYDFGVLFPDMTFGLERPMAPKPLFIPKAKAATPAAKPKQPQQQTPAVQPPKQGLGLKDFNFPKPPGPGTPALGRIQRPKGPIAALQQGTPGFATPGAASPATPAGFQGPATPTTRSPLVPGLGRGKAPIVQLNYNKPAGGGFFSMEVGSGISGPMAGVVGGRPAYIRDQNSRRFNSGSTPDQMDTS